MSVFDQVPVLQTVLVNINETKYIVTTFVTYTLIKFFIQEKKYSFQRSRDGFLSPAA
jgi:hypothetical protein